MQALAAWHDFYTLLGGASATMTGLLFVAASVGTGVFSRDRSAPLRVFLSGSVVLFGSILAVSLVALSPLRDAGLLSVMIAGCGCFGLAYYGIACHGLRRDRMMKSIDWDDRLWYVALPVTGYLAETAAGILLAARPDLGCEILAFALGMLLLAAIHNAWDITVWSITRRPN